MKPTIERVVKWLPIVGYEDIYEISDTGLVKRIRGGRGSQRGLISLKDRGSGYYTVGLCQNSKARDFYVHHLVATAFIGTRPPKYDINHIDGNRKNNNVENLEYVTVSQNLAHSYVMGRKVVPPDWRKRKKNNHSIEQRDEIIGRVVKMLNQGFTRAEATKAVGIGCKTFYSWTKKIEREV